jgi:serine/threonine protein kinase
MPKGFEVPEAEWLAAEAYFKKHPNAIKLERTVDNKGKPRQTPQGKVRKSINDYKGPDLRHSFQVARDISGNIFTDQQGNLKIYAISNRDLGYLGQGAFGKVKQAQNKQGELFAFKIEGSVNKALRAQELQVLDKLGLLEATNLIDFGPGEKRLWRFEEEEEEETRERMLQQKNYTIQKIAEGIDLSAFVYPFDPNQVAKRGAHQLLTDLQKLQVAVKACEAVQNLHEQGILHNDISSGNIKVNFEGENITVNLIDFAFSNILEEGHTTHPTPKKPIGSFLAPEIEYAIMNPKKPAMYSMASDCYSLGKVFRVEMALDALKDPDLTKLINEMTAPKPEKRISLKEAQKRLHIIISKYAAFKNIVPEEKSGPEAPQEGRIAPLVPHSPRGAIINRSKEKISSEAELKGSLASKPSKLKQAKENKPPTPKRPSNS